MRKWVNRDFLDRIRRDDLPFERYCRGIQGTRQLVQELKDLTHRVHYDFDERSRKEVQMYSHKLSRNEKDFRKDVRMNYSLYLK